METALTILAGVLVALATAFFTSRAYVHQATADQRHHSLVELNLSVLEVSIVLPVLKLADLLTFLLLLDVVDTRQNVSLPLPTKSTLGIVRVFLG